MHSFRRDELEIGGRTRDEISLSATGTGGGPIDIMPYIAPRISTSRGIRVPASQHSTL
jgi:hypothetical protein